MQSFTVIRVEYFYWFQEGVLEVAPSDLDLRDLLGLSDVDEVGFEVLGEFIDCVVRLSDTTIVIVAVTMLVVVVNDVTTVCWW